MSIRSLLLLFTIAILSGCSVVYSDVKQAYVSAKVIYQDAKYVVHEIQDEVEVVKEELDEKSKMLSTSILGRVDVPLLQVVNDE